MLFIFYCSHFQNIKLKLLHFNGRTLHSSMMANLVFVNLQVDIKWRCKAADDFQYWEVSVCVETWDARPIFKKNMQMLFHFSIPFSPSVYKTFMASTNSAISAIALLFLFICIHYCVERCIAYLGKNFLPSSCCRSFRKLGYQAGMRSMQIVVKVVHKSAMPGFLLIFIFWLD